MWKLTLDYFKQDFKLSFATFQYDYKYKVGIICMMQEHLHRQ
jgi:hypothetical protein